MDARKAAEHAVLDLRGVIQCIEREDWPALLNLQHGINESIDELAEAFNLDGE